MLFMLFSMTALSGCFSPRPWLDDPAEAPVDSVVVDLPVPKDFLYLTTRGFAEEDPVFKNRYIEAYYRGDRAPDMVEVELEREMSALKWTPVEKSKAGDKKSFRFEKTRPGGENRRELCEIEIWRIGDATFVKFKIRPNWRKE